MADTFAAISPLEVVDPDGLDGFAAEAPLEVVDPDGLDGFAAEAPLEVFVDAYFACPEPVITFTSPPGGAAIYRYTPVVFTVLDAENRILGVLVRVTFSARADLGWDFAHDGVQFGPNYRGAANARVTVEGGYQYTVLRDGGWPAAPTISPYAFNCCCEE